MVGMAMRRLAATPQPTSEETENQPRLREGARTGAVAGVAVGAVGTGSVVSSGGVNRTLGKLALAAEGFSYCTLPREKKPLLSTFASALPCKPHEICSSVMVRWFLTSAVMVP